MLPVAFQGLPWTAPDYRAARQLDRFARRLRYCRARRTKANPQNSTVTTRFGPTTALIMATWFKKDAPGESSPATRADFEAAWDRPYARRSLGRQFLSNLNGADDRTMPQDDPLNPN